MEKNTAKALIESLESATITGVDQSTLGQVIEDSLHPLLKEHIFELHYNHHGRSSYANFERDFDLHREIVKFFTEMAHGGFSLSTLDRYQALQTRLLQREELEGKIAIESDTKKLLTMLEKYITQIRPLISPERARAYLGEGKKEKSPSEVYESDVTSIVRVGDTGSESTIYQNYFKALIAREQVTQQLTVAKKERQDLQKSFTQLSSSETQKLGLFKNDRDPKYSSLVYAVKYGEWRLRQLRKGAITINVKHSFE